MLINITDEILMDGPTEFPDGLTETPDGPTEFPEIPPGYEFQI
jgi:hypothetical protein